MVANNLADNLENKSGKVSPTGQILVVEDEKEIRDLICLHLLRQGYSVRAVSSCEEGLTYLQEQDVSLTILDWMLPQMPGIEFLRQVKKIGYQMPILMVTAKASPDDVVHGLEAGADDYLIKPFEPSVLMARVKALLRRALALKGQSPVPGELNTENINNDLFSMQELEVNYKSCQVRVQGEPLPLTASEFKLLATLARNQGRVMTRDQLISEIQGEGISVIGRTIDTHVFGLRKKLGICGDYIETMRGIGYRMKDLD